MDELQKSGKDNTWLNKKLVNMNVDVHAILLATIDSNDEFKFYL